MKTGAPDKSLQTALKLIQLKEARNDFLAFAQAMKPDPEDPDNPKASLFQVKPHHCLIAEALQEVAAGKCLRLVISMPPQHGKTEQISRLFPAWIIGKKPWMNIMIGGYSQDFVNQNISTHVREFLESPQYKMIFPAVELRKDSRAKEFMRTTQHGQLAFLGRGGAGTGKPADGFVIDDPIKDDEEAQSPTTRDKVWQWFCKVAYTRCHSMSWIVIVHTRWNEDDLIGRLVDKEHPAHDPEIAKHWKVLNIPAVVKEPELADAMGIGLAIQDDPSVVSEFGTEPMAALWPERFTLEHLASAHRLNPRGFNALYQGKPSADDGDYFRREDLQLYSRADLPSELRIFAASDHALSEKQHADFTVLGCVGIDSQDHIWVLPDLIWDRIPTDRTVEEMIAMMKRRKPAIWFAESDNIKKSIGPFLRKRMREEKVYTPVLDMPSLKSDKEMRARSIQGRIQMGMVHLPKFAHWTQKAIQEMLKFPNGAHDDFVDFIAWIGLGLDSERGAASMVSKPSGPKRGTFGWLKWQTKQKEKRSMGAIRGGW